MISEAKKCGLRLILCLVNNWDDFGGKKQYVQWARDEGQNLSGDDDFYSNAVIKGYYKNHVKVCVMYILETDVQFSTQYCYFIVEHVCETLL